MRRLDARRPHRPWSPRGWGNSRCFRSAGRGWYRWVITAIAVVVVLLSAGMTGVVDRTGSATEPVRQTLIGSPGRGTATATLVEDSAGIRSAPELAWQGVRERADPVGLLYRSVDIDRGLGHVAGLTRVVGPRSVASLAAAPAAFSLMPQPVPKPHIGNIGRWHYETTAKIVKHKLSLDATVTGKDDGDAEIKVHVHSEIKNFDPAGVLHGHNDTIDRLVFHTNNMDGTVNFDWTASKPQKSNAVGVPEAERNVKLPALAELPLVIQGQPFTLEVGSSLHIASGLTAANEKTHGRFTIHFSGDMGFDLGNGAVIPGGNNLLVDAVTIEPDTASTSLAAFGFISVAALPKFTLQPGFTEALFEDDPELKTWVKRIKLGTPRLPGSGPYVQLLTTAGEYESGPLGLLPCEKTTAIFFLGGGVEGTKADPIVLNSAVRANPPTQFCSKDFTAPPPGHPQPVDTPECDPSATGDQSDFFGVPSGSTLSPRGDPRLGGGHPGLDVQRLRDAPVYANFRDTIPITDLNKAIIESFQLQGQPNAGRLVLNATGNAKLVDAQIRVQPFSTLEDFQYGGVVYIAAHYNYTDKSGKERIFTALIRYFHLIDRTHLPRTDKVHKQIDNQDQELLAKDSYHGCTGFGSLMKDGILTPAQLDTHPLIGYLGATQNQHVHISAIFNPGLTPGDDKGLGFDPGVILNHNP
jgi:hypothetical protein